MRIKFLRIFPDTCASTWCLFSNSTLNMAFGRGSRTTAITSIASSLLMHPLNQLLAFSSWLLAKSQEPKANSLFRQNHWPIFRHRHAMLKVCAETAIGGDRGPLIAQNARLRLAKIHHRFDGDYHAFAQLRAVTPRSVIRHLRLFVQVRSNSMPNELANHAEARGFHML